MQQAEQKFIALLRGINVGGHNKIPMAELRSLCTQVGWGDVVSYIQSGNLVFTSAMTPAELEDQLEQSIKQHFGFSIPVIIRSSESWCAITGENPFPGASDKEPNLVMLGLTKRPPEDDIREGLRKYAKAGEHVELVDDHLWIHFPGGVGRSKITPAVLDRVAGSTVTMRNWRTVIKLRELIAENPAG